MYLRGLMYMCEACVQIRRICGAVEHILLICAFEEGYKDIIEYFVNFILVHKLFHNHIRMIYPFTSISLKKIPTFPSG